MITESSSVQYDKKEKATVIEVTEAEFEKIANQYDTKVLDWKVISQTKWDNAEKIEQERLIAQAEREKQQSKSAE